MDEQNYLVLDDNGTETKSVIREEEHFLAEECETSELFEEEVLEQEEPPEEKERFSLGREILSLVCYLALLISLTYLFLTYVGQRTVVEGDSMNMTLEDSQSVYLDKLTYRFSDPKRYDIVVFKYLYKYDEDYIKRVIALPGETVQIIDGYVYVDKNDGNGLQKLEDDRFCSDPIFITNYGRASEPVVLGEDEYFCMGDNRNNSHDSRKEDVGNVNKDQILGKAVVRIWPLNKISILKRKAE